MRLAQGLKHGCLFRTPPSLGESSCRGSASTRYFRPPRSDLFQLTMVVSFVGKGGKIGAERQCQPEREGGRRGSWKTEQSVVPPQAVSVALLLSFSFALSLHRLSLLPLSLGNLQLCFQTAGPNRYPAWLSRSQTAGWDPSPRCPSAH